MKTWRRWIIPALGLGGFLFCTNFRLWAQDPKPAPTKKVEILLVDGWPVPPTMKKYPVKLTIRGMGLDLIERVEAIPATGSPILIKIIKKEKSGAPANRDANQGGDSHLELEFPSGMFTPKSLRLHTKGNPSQFDLPWMGTTDSFQMEKEPNGGFGESQSIVANQLILGTISPAKDVDVFSLSSPPGCKSLILSGTNGNQLTLLRPFLMIHTAQGDLLKAFEWDLDRQIVVPVSGLTKYYISILDALDSTSGFHHYAFRVEFR